MILGAQLLCIDYTRPANYGVNNTSYSHWATEQTMTGKLTKLGAFLICLAVPACGPALDLRDAIQGRYGPNTPTGSWKRDFWGRSYFEPYPWLTVPKHEASGAIPQPTAHAEEAGKSP